MENTREMTYGEKLVGLTFNPSGNPDVDAIKAKYAEIIDLLNKKITPDSTSQQKRHIAIAITEAQAAQMWAVKAITLPEYV